MRVGVKLPLVSCTYNFMRFSSGFMRRFRYIAKPGVESESQVCSYIFEIQAPGLRQTFCLALGAR